LYGKEEFILQYLWLGHTSFSGNAENDHAEVNQAFGIHWVAGAELVANRG
jgi:hypothetical protein